MVLIKGHDSQNTRLQRWLMSVQEYDYNMKHRPGKSLTHVDSLSRSEHHYVWDDDNVLCPELFTVDDNSNDKKPDEVDRDIESIDDSIGYYQDELVTALKPKINTLNR